MATARLWPHHYVLYRYCITLYFLSFPDLKKSSSFCQTGCHWLLLFCLPTLFFSVMFPVDLSCVLICISCSLLTHTHTHTHTNTQVLTQKIHVCVPHINCSTIRILRVIHDESEMQTIKINHLNNEDGLITPFIEII